MIVPPNWKGESKGEPNPNVSQTNSSANQSGIKIFNLPPRQTNFLLGGFAVGVVFGLYKNKPTQTSLVYGLLGAIGGILVMRFVVGKPTPTQNIPSPEPAPSPNPSPAPFIPPIGKKYAYRIKKDIIVGYLPNSNGKPNILFKAGDVVYAGVPFERFLFNKQMKGIEAAPTISGAYIATPNKMHFIPLEFLDALATSNV